MHAQPDAVLCRLAARGNVSAYDAIYQRYRQPVYAFVFHLLGRVNGNEDAEDITQDVFTRAFAGIREQRVNGGFRSWLFTIARNRTFDEIRGGRQKVVSLDAEHAEPPEAPEAQQPAQQAEQRAEFAWLMSAVADLPERQREALLLREMGGFSHERIAEELGTSVSATKKLISRGRDGVGAAAAGVGYNRFSKRRLGNDLAMAAPIVPITITLSSLGITGGVAAGGAAASGAIAGGGAIVGGKTAATALTFLAIGGGAVAVEHDASKGRKTQTTAAQEQAIAGPVKTERVANGVAGGRPALPSGVVDDRRGRRGDGGADDRRDERDDDSSERGPGSADRVGREDSSRRGASGSGRGEEEIEADERGEDRSGRGGGDSGSSGSGSDDAVESEDPPPPPELEDDGSHQSGEGSGSGEDPEVDVVSDDSPDD
jgi:RNA polymerase sigma factor (sigma-70 family)